MKGKKRRERVVPSEKRYKDERLWSLLFSKTSSGAESRGISESEQAGRIKNISTSHERRKPDL